MGSIHRSGSGSVQSGLVLLFKGSSELLHGRSYVSDIRTCIGLPPSRGGLEDCSVGKSLLGGNATARLLKSIRIQGGWPWLDETHDEVDYTSGNHLLPLWDLTEIWRVDGRGIQEGKQPYSSIELE